MVDWGGNVAVPQFKMRAWRIDLNDVEGPLFSPPPMRLYCSFCTYIGELKAGLNVLRFRDIGGGGGPPLNILHCVLEYGGSVSR
jgi:hypothetical protein